MLNIGIFTSLKGQGSLDLLKGILDAIDSGYLSGVEAKYVFCDRPEMIQDSLREEMKTRDIALFSKSSHELRRIIAQITRNEGAVRHAREKFDRGVFEIIEN